VSRRVAKVKSPNAPVTELARDDADPRSSEGRIAEPNRNTVRSNSDEPPPGLHVRDYLALLHPPGRRGKVTFAQSGEEWTQRSVPVSGAGDEAEFRAGQSDSYVSCQTFYGARRVNRLAQLGASYVDLDYYTAKDWCDFSAAYVTYAVLDFLNDEGVPSPSFVLATGRGLLVFWLHDLVPKQALPRWNAIQGVLVRKLAGFGADVCARDAARVFRMIGTVNSKTGEPVRLTYPNEAPTDVQRWEFDTLADEILPLARSELAARRLKRKQKVTAPAKPRPAQRLTGASYWQTVLADLRCLGHARWSGRLPPGHRDKWLFVVGVGLSWTVAPSCLRRALHAHAAKEAGWSEAECNGRMSTIFRRATAVSGGEKRDWNERRIEPRYRMRASTIIGWLGITEAEMRSCDLRVLVTKTVAGERAAERQRARRRLTGAAPRAGYEQAAAARQEEAARLRASGLSWREVAVAVGLPSSDAARMCAGRAGLNRKANRCAR
jgi:hypothetical protein